MMQFPRTEVEGLSLSRMIIGSNWMAGYSHRSPSADRMIVERHSTTKNLVPMLETFQEYGVDTIMALFSQHPVIVQAIREASEKTGKEFILVDTPIINVDDSATARAEAKAIIQKSREIGSKICLIHHSSAEQLVNKNKRTMDRLDDYTYMIREAGMIPGLSAHMPELIVYSDLNGYDVQTYIQIYNCMGFLMQVEVETVNQIIHDAKKPVMTIKPMAAGRTTPFVGLNFNWATLRDCDMVTVGCFNEHEAREDIEISLAALERRRVNIEKRSSPNQKQDAFGGNQ
ncbi:MAG: hypothetical protein IJ412_02485 [Oscillospiraceae bacterium]|nr:hypothetical protein [Oscillospiraceae bacterium]